MQTCDGWGKFVFNRCSLSKYSDVMGGALPSRSYPREAHVERTNNHDYVHSFFCPDLYGASLSVGTTGSTSYYFNISDGISSKEGGLIIFFMNAVNAYNTKSKCRLTSRPNAGRHLVWESYSSCGLLQAETRLPVSFELTAQSYKYLPLLVKESTTPDGRTCVQHLHQPCISL